MGYLAEAPPLNVACAQAAEVHSQQLSRDLQEAPTEQQVSSSAKQKPESKGAAGASSAGGKSVLVSQHLLYLHCFVCPTLAGEVLCKNLPQV